MKLCLDVIYIRFIYSLSLNSLMRGCDYSRGALSLYPNGLCVRSVCYQLTSERIGTAPTELSHNRLHVQAEVKRRKLCGSDVEEVGGGEV